LTTRGSGVQTGSTAAIGGESVAATFVDMNTLNVATPALNAGKYRVEVTNPRGETAWLDASFTSH